MVALIRHLDAGPAVIVGESMAAGAAIWAAAEAPEGSRAWCSLGRSCAAKAGPCSSWCFE